MKNYTGSILELNTNYATVMTDSCDFVTIHPQPDMFVGQQIKFKESDIKKSNKYHVKYFALAASVFVIGLCSIIFFRFSNLTPVLAYIDVDINPSIELTIDKDAEVIDIKALNEDAQIVLKDLNLMDLQIKEAITEVVTVSKELGYLNNNKGNTVLISASLEEDTNDKQNASSLKALDEVLTDISSINISAENKSIKPEIIKVTPNSRKAAIEKGLSMGRYALFSKIKAKNSDITVEKAKTERISEMLVKAKIKSDKSESNVSGLGSDNTDFINTESNEPNKFDSNDSNVKSNDSNSTNSNSKDNYTRMPDFKDPASSHSSAKKSDNSFAKPDNKDKKSDVKEPSPSKFGSKKSNSNDPAASDNGAKKSDSSSATPDNKDKKSDVKEPSSSEFGSKKPEFKYPASKGGSKKSDSENRAPSDGNTNMQSPKDSASKGHGNKNAGSK